MINQIFFQVTIAIIIYTFMALWLIFVLWSYVILLIFYTLWVGCCVYEEFTRKEYFTMYFIAMFIIYKILKLIFYVYLIASIKIIVFFLFICKTVHIAYIFLFFVWWFMCLVAFAKNNIHFANPGWVWFRINYALEVFVERFFWVIQVIFF